MRAGALLSLMALGVAALSGAQAAEFRSMGSVAVLYDAPSLQAKRLFVAPRGMPVEVLASTGSWVKIRDVAGDFAWAERSDVSSLRTLVCRAPTVLRAAAEEAAEPLMHVDRAVVLELLDAAGAPGWARVRHRDGVTGYVRATSVWGL